MEPLNPDTQTVESSSRRQKLTVIVLAVILLVVLFIRWQELGRFWSSVTLNLGDSQAGATDTVVLKVPSTGANLNSFPVKSGIPFPVGAVSSINNLRLESLSGIEVPAQFKSLALWPDGSIKSALTVFNTPLLAVTELEYNLRYGPGITRSNYNTGLTVKDLGSTIEVENASIKANFDKNKFTFIDQLWVDLDNNGLFEDGERQLSAPGDIYLINAFNSQEYRASSYSTTNYTIEESGPVRVVVKAEGSLQAASGEQLTDFKVWFNFFENSPYVEIEYTLVDTRPEQNVNSVGPDLALSVTEYGLELPMNLSGAAYSFGGENGVEYSGAVSGEHYLFQDGLLNYVDKSFRDISTSYSGEGNGAKAPGWMYVEDSGGGFGAMVRYFWQQFPKEFNVDSNGVKIKLHPSRATGGNPDLQYPSLSTDDNRYIRPNTFYSPREGMAKTYNVVLYFGEQGSKNVVKQSNEAVQVNYPLLGTSAQWYADSGVFGYTLPAGTWSEGYDVNLITSVYERSVQECRDQGCLAFLYGWRDFGDRMRPGWEFFKDSVGFAGFYVGTHIGGVNFMSQYIRTLDTRWWELAENESRFYADIGISHATRSGYPTSNGPGEPHNIKHDVNDHTSRNLHAGHSQISALPDYYLLTGDPRIKEVLDEEGSWFTNYFQGRFPLPVPEPHTSETGRDFGWPIFVMNELYRGTGNVAYLESSARAVEHLVGWWQQESQHLLNGEVLGTNDWTQGTGYWYSFPKCDNCSNGTNGTQPWMDSPMLSQTIKFLEYSKPYNYFGLDKALIEEMLLQNMNYIYKWGFDPDPNNPGEGIWVYSEERRYSGGGSFQLLYSMAYLWDLYRTGGGMNSAWYDTADDWLFYIDKQFQNWKEVRYRGNTASGWYGYEFFVPTDFFRLMYDLEQEGVLPSQDGATSTAVPVTPTPTSAATPGPTATVVATPTLPPTATPGTTQTPTTVPTNPPTAAPSATPTFTPTAPPATPTFAPTIPPATPTLVPTAEPTNTPAPTFSEGNEPPFVDALGDLIAFANEITYVRAIIFDDGLPINPGKVSVTWSLLNGSGNVVFTNADKYFTPLVFDTEGIYFLQITATDGEFTTSDEKVVVVAKRPLDFSQVSFEWSVLSGPGTVTFESPNEIRTKAFFEKSGRYYLRIKITYKQWSINRDIAVTIK